MNTSDVLLPDWLGRCAVNQPGHLAVQAGGVRWSFAELNRQVTSIARQLAGAEVREGSRVALLAANGLSFVAFVHAMTRLGAVLVPLNTRLTREELTWQVGDARAIMLVSDERHAGIAAEIERDIVGLRCVMLRAAGDEALLCDLPEADVALRSLIDLDMIQAIMYTSGTTGQPKGAIITYGMQWWNAIGSALNLGHHPGDRWLACLPLFHIGGLAILMRSVVYGISVIVQEKFDVLAVNRAIDEDGVTIISVVAVMLQRMLDARGPGRFYPAALRCVLLGGGPAPRALLEDCAGRGVPVVQTYGMTEACSQAVTLAPADALRKPGSAGRPLLTVQLRIMRDGRQAQEGEPGEIELRGATITPGDADRPDATTQAFHDGWFATGDIGYLDEEGYLYVLDRRADLIISGGENVYPAEVEAVLASHPDVIEAGVCGQPDPQWGHVPVAFVHLRAGSSISAEELMAYAAIRLARYKLPRTIYFTGQLPRNASGKLLRRELLRCK
ncbi:MAG TPA: o-succinylbenzoate--CoA ligase [Ktedonobacteraceae bacterium]|nr:o-succinylbenzoate--CoA ligase [Ktedonobacteraceae bacterium]